MCLVSATSGPSHDSAGQAPPLPMVWRVGRAGQILSWLGITVSALIILVATSSFAEPDTDRTGPAIATAFGIVVALTLWRAGIHPSVTATDVGVVIRNPLETVTVPWDDLVQAQAGHAGVTISRLSAPPATIWAVQKANLSAWRGTQTRADAVAATIQALASARCVNAEGKRPTSRPIARRRPEPSDAVQTPLRFPWRMSVIEAAVIGFLRHPTSPVLSAGAALLFGALGLMNLGFLVSDQWDVHLLQERGVVVEGTVVGVPGQVDVTWPGIAPKSMFLEAGDDAEERYSTGDVVQVLVDPQDPTRARLAGVERTAAGLAWQLGLGLGALFLASGYAKWARWLAATRHAALPPPPGRHRSGSRR